jgi:hypothetical protein
MRRTVSSSCILAMLSFGPALYCQTTGQSPTQPTSQAGSQRMEQARQPGDRTQTDQQVTLVGCIQREADYRKAHQGGRGGTLGTGFGAGNEFVLINASAGTESGSQTAMSGSAGQTTGTTSGTGSAGTAGTTTGTAGTTAGTTSGTSPTGTSATGTTTGTTRSSESTTPSSGSMTAMSGGTAYALTGNRERELESHVGQRVEIVGRIEGGGRMAGGSTSATGSAGTTATTGSTPATGTSGQTTSGTATGTTSGGTTTGSAQAGVTGETRGAGFDALQQINITSFRVVGGTCPAQ